MSIEAYKELNEQLVTENTKQREYKRYLENELVALNAKYIDLHTLYIHEKYKMQNLLVRFQEFKNKFYDDIEQMEYCIQDENSYGESRSSEIKRKSFESMRRKSSGVTSRSPTNSFRFSKSIEIEENTEQTSVALDKKNSDSDHLCDFGIISEMSAEDYNEPSGVENDNETIKPTIENITKRRKALSPKNSLDPNELIKEMQNICISNPIKITVSPCKSNSEENEQCEITEKTIVAARSCPLQILPRLSHPVPTDISSFISSEEFLLNSSKHSTPHSKTMLNKNEETTASASDIPEINDENSISLRPKRRCAPKSLVEPNLYFKLRNEHVKKQPKIKKTKKVPD